MLFQPYLFHVLACFRTDLLEERSLYLLTVWLSLLFGDFANVLQVQFGSNHKKDCFLWYILLDFSYPNSQFCETLVFLDRVEKYDSSNAFVMWLYNRFECFLSHLN